MISSISGIFLVSPVFLPISLVVPIAGFLAWGWRWFFKLVICMSAPAILVLAGLLTDNQELVISSSRWALSVASGMMFFTIIGVDRAAAFFRKLSCGTGGKIADFFDLIDEILTSAGPVLTFARRCYREARKSGRNYCEAFILTVDNIRSGIPEDLNKVVIDISGDWRKSEIAILAASWGFLLLGVISN
jgi:hypothetical protein